MRRLVRHWAALARRHFTHIAHAVVVLHIANGHPLLRLPVFCSSPILHTCSVSALMQTQPGLSPLLPHLPPTTPPTTPPNTGQHTYSHILSTASSYHRWGICSSHICVVCAHSLTHQCVVPNSGESLRRPGPGPGWDRGGTEGHWSDRDPNPLEKGQKSPPSY